MAKKKLTSTKAKKILHDKEVHGHPLTEQQRKFFGAIAGGAKPYKAEFGGWLDKYEEGGVLKQKKEDNYGTKPNANNSKVSLPPGFVGMAYNTKGRNYSPAWGGQFQMGGSLPGAVGFTYARTAGAAPANGPYAKKTKASAQNGQEMKYYQEGLDFTPKTISQDGSATSSKPKKKTLILAEEPAIDKGKFDPENPFAKEAENIKKYVNKYFPDEDVEIVPAYKDSFREGLKKSDPNTRLVFLGHYGSNLFGIPASEVVETISKTPYENCYGGTCYGSDLFGIGQANKPEQWRYYQERRSFDVPISDYQGLKRAPESYNLRNFNVRTDHIPWLGFAPVERGGEEGFRDSFFRRTENPEIRKALESLREAKSQEDFDKIAKKIDKIRKSGAEYVNTPTAANYTELDVVPFPARTKNYPVRPIGLQDGGDLKKAQVGKELRPIPRATGDLRGPKIDPRFAENIAAAKDRDAYSTFEELRSTPGLKLYSDEELAKLSKQDPSKWSKHVKQEYGDRQSKKTLIQAHPDYNPEMPFESQEALANDKSLKARVLRGKNLLTDPAYGSGPLAIANQIITAPANLVSNLAFNPYEKYIKPGVAEGLTNVLSDVMDAIDPVNPGTIMKAALKAAPKAALKLSTALPFYTTLRRLEDANPVDAATFTRSADRLRDLVSTPSSRQAFADVAEQLSIPRVAQADPAYVEAINDPNLPLQSIDEVVKSLTAIDPAEVALNREQLKYVKNLGSLSTDISTLSERSSIDPLNISEFIIEQSGASSPRDVVPFIHSLRGLSGDQKMDIITRLYDSRAGVATNNPLARFTAAQDLFTLAERFRDIPQILSSGQFSVSPGTTYMGNQIRQGFENLISSAENVRPKVGISPQYERASGNYYDAEDVFGALFRPAYQRVPTAAERAASSQDVARRVMQRQKEIFTPPRREDYTSDLRYDMAVRNFESDRGKTFIGSKSMSSDSYEMAQRAATLKDRLNFDIIPMFLPSLGGMNPRPSISNTYGGITKLGAARRTYSDNIQNALTNRLATGLNTAEKEMVRMGRAPLDPRVIQNLMIETRMANATNAELNRQLGTNIPTSIVDVYGSSIQRPVIGFIPRSGSTPTTSLMDGGNVVKDDMGYWNPENWGKVVEIDSNQITMKGVDQPLLGISDTGDVQYMMPGEDYEFDGEYVTEYPMAKKGISVNNADAQPLKKLDQLFNFTNYNKPTRGGWLDKYQ